MPKKSKPSALKTLALYLTSLALAYCSTHAHASGSNSPRQNYGPPGAHPDMGSLEGTRHLNEAIKGHQTLQNIRHQKPEPDFKSAISPRLQKVIKETSQKGRDDQARKLAEQRKHEETTKKKAQEARARVKARQENANKKAITAGPKSRNKR